MPLFVESRESSSRTKLIIVGLCLFIALLSFKPSEPYLSEFLICGLDTQAEFCSKQGKNDCNSSEGCGLLASSNNVCSFVDCKNPNISRCGDETYFYCVKDGDICNNAKCYKNFAENQVNNEIYPWYFIMSRNIILILTDLSWKLTFSWQVDLCVFTVSNRLRASC